MAFLHSAAPTTKMCFQTTHVGQLVGEYRVHKGTANLIVVYCSDSCLVLGYIKVSKMKYLRSCVCMCVRKTEECVNLSTEKERFYKCAKKLCNRLVAKEAIRLWSLKFLAGFETPLQISTIIQTLPSIEITSQNLCPIMLGITTLTSEKVGEQG